LLLGISKMPIAIAHSLILISFNAVVSGTIYIKEVSLTGNTILIIVALAAIGSFIGSLLLKTIPTKRLQQGFSFGLAVLGIAMLGKLALEIAG